MSSNNPTTLNDLLSSDASDLTPEQKALALDDILAEFGSAPQPMPAEPPRPAPDTAPKARTAPAASAAGGPTSSPSLVIDGVDFSEFLSDTAAAPAPSSVRTSEDAPEEPVAASAAETPVPAAPAEKASPAVPAQTAPPAPAARSLVIDGVDFSEFLSDEDAAEVSSPASASDRTAQSAEKPEQASSETPQPRAEDESAPRPEIRRRKATPGGIALRIAAFAAVLATVVFLYTQVMQDRVSSASFDDVSRAVLAELDLDEMQQADAQMIRRLYGFAPSEMDGCTLYYPSTNMGARELLIVKLSDLSQQKAVTDAVTARRQTQMNSFEGYGVEQYDLLEHSVLEVQGNYILFVVHENADAARQSFLKAL